MAVFGTVVVVYLLIVLIYKAAVYSQDRKALPTALAAYSIEDAFNKDGPAVLAGFLSGSYFVHSGIVNLGKCEPDHKNNYEIINILINRINCFIITKVKDNRNQANNKRDIFLSYVFVVISYFFFGFLYYFTFPAEKLCMSDLFTEASLNSINI